MNLKLTAIVAVGVTGLCSTVLGAFTTTPDFITMLLVGVAAIIVASIVLLVLFQIPWLGTLSPKQQCRVIWITAGGTGSSSVCCRSSLAF